MNFEKAASVILSEKLVDKLWTGYIPPSCAISAGDCHSTILKEKAGTRARKVKKMKGCSSTREEEGEARKGHATGMVDCFIAEREDHSRPLEF
jgi:hypothetical protein